MELGALNEWITAHGWTQTEWHKMIDQSCLHSQNVYSSETLRLETHARINIKKRKTRFTLSTSWPWHAVFHWRSLQVSGNISAVQTKANLYGKYE